MKTIDIPTSTSTIETDEHALEKQALQRVYEEVLAPNVGEEGLRAVAQEVAQYPGFAFSVEIPQLLENFYTPRALTGVTSDGRARTDFATRDFDDQKQMPGNALDGWFTALEDGTMRYAFAHRNFYKDYYPGVEETATRPYAITIAPDQSVQVTTMIYRHGSSEEAPLRDDAQRQECIEEAFFDMFLAARRMAARTPEERGVANADAREKLGRRMRSLQISQDTHHSNSALSEWEPRSADPNPSTTEGLSWIIPSDFAY